MAFGAVYPWAAPPLLILAAAAAFLARVRPDFSDPLDAGAIAALAVIAAQLLPLPAGILAVLSPASAAFRAEMVLGYDPRAWAPLSLNPAGTRLALMLAASAYLLFAAARADAATDGRRLARGIAWSALLLAVLGIGARFLFPDGRVYGFWTPREPGAQPFGAFINRNHFAAWAAMAAAISAGCFASDIARRYDRAPAKGLVYATLSDARALWVIFSMFVTVAALVTTGSRSGFAAIVVACAAALLMVRLRAGPRVAARIGIAVVVLGLGVIGWAQSDRLLSRVTGVKGDPRPQIWQQSAAIAARYPLTGVGAGAFPAAMTYYQTGTRDAFFNHAHNQYLELGAEGGLLLGIPLAIFLAGMLRAISRSLASDRGSYFWLRVGAAAGLAGLLVACLWESPFRTPATLMIAATAAGIATTQRRG